MTWKEISLGQAIEIKHGYGFKGEFFTNAGQYILLTPGNCYERGGLRLKGDREKYYVGSVPDEFILKANDLVVVMTDLVNAAPILGGALIVPEDDKFLHNQRLGLVTILDESQFDKTFIFYVLNSEYYRAQVRGSASGATVRHTAPKRIYDCKVRVPSFDEQHKIASTLSAYDNLIANNNRRIELLEQTARLLFKEWFVYLRYPGHEHDKIRDGVPNGWQRKLLSVIAKTNVSNHSKKSLPAAVTYVDISSVEKGRIIHRTEYSADEAPGRARRKASDGDTIWSNVRPNLKQYALVLDPNENDVFSTGFTILTPTTVPFSFLYLYVTTDNFVSHLVNHTTGASYPAVRADDFEGMDVLLPKASLLTSFHAICEPMFRLMDKLNRQNEKLSVARDFLLPRLMDGRVSV